MQTASPTPTLRPEHRTTLERAKRLGMLRADYDLPPETSIQPATTPAPQATTNHGLEMARPPAAHLEAEIRALRSRVTKLEDEALTARRAFTRLMTALSIHLPVPIAMLNELQDKLGIAMGDLLPGDDYAAANQHRRKRFSARR